MPLTTVNGLMKVNVDVREVMNSYICDKVGIDARQYPDARHALDDLAIILISLGKERGIKIKVVISEQ